MLDPEFKTKWVDALRSGEFNQGRYALSSEGRYCCLGVAAMLMLPEGAEDRAAYDTDVYEASDNWLKHEQIQELIDLNDDQKKDFDQIADWIEANL